MRSVAAALAILALTCCDTGIEGDGAATLDVWFHSGQPGEREVESSRGLVVGRSVGEFHDRAAETFGERGEHALARATFARLEKRDVAR